MGRSIGFRFKENMYGHYVAFEGPAAGKELPFTFRWELEYRSLLGMLRGEPTEAGGWVEAQGLARHADLEGIFEMKPFSERFIRYTFRFAADDGRVFRFEGQKNIRYLHPLRTLTTLPGAILDADGRRLSGAVVRFRLGELLTFLLTFRLGLVRG
jgi:hypothetical protein